MKRHVSLECYQKFQPKHRRAEIRLAVNLG